MQWFFSNRLFWRKFEITIKTAYFEVKKMLFDNLKIFFQNFHLSFHKIFFWEFDEWRNFLSIKKFHISAEKLNYRKWSWMKGESAWIFQIKSFPLFLMKTTTLKTFLIIPKQEFLSSRMLFSVFKNDQNISLNIIICISVSHTWFG